MKKHKIKITHQLEKTSHTFSVRNPDSLTQEEVKNEDTEKENNDDSKTEKLTASQRVKIISRLGTIELVENALKGETAKSVKDAGSKRIKDLSKK